MIICIIGYVVLLFLVLQKQKRKIFVWCEEKTGRQILLILFCANTIALGLFWLDRQEKDSGEIERNVYGGGSRRETYEITIGQTLKEKEVTIDVEEQRYTSQETKKIFKRVMEKMDEVILGENKSLDRVEKDLNLLTEWKDYPVQIQWELDHYEVINVQGEIQTEKTKAEGTLVELTGKLTYGGEEALYVTNAMVYPESKSKEEKLLSDVLQLVEEKEKTTKTKNTKETTKTTTASKNESTAQTAENQTTEAKQEQSCEFLISCKTVLSNKSALQSNYQVPSGGKIYEKKMEFEEGDTVMDVLKRTGVDIDVSKGYVAGIDGLYEFDCGKNSGWMYRVNGKFPNYMAGKCKLHDGDKVEWLYTCVRGDL